MKQVPWVIAIDIGGTRTKLALVDPSGAQLCGTAFDTPQTDLNDFLEALSVAINALRGAKQRQIIGLAVGAPAVDRRKGRVFMPPNLPWPEETLLSELLSTIYKLPVVLLNDAEAAAIGEMAYGRAKHLRDFVYITLGTGLGAACILNGALLEGSHGIAMEVGHMCFRKNGRKCGCGKRGCLETYVSATALRRTYFELYRGEEQMLGHAKTLSAEAIALRTNDPFAEEAIKQTAVWFGEALANVVQITGIGSIFVAGGLAKSADLLLPVARTALEDALMPALRGQVTVEASMLLDAQPALLGAAHYFFQQHTKKSR